MLTHGQRTSLEFEVVTTEDRAMPRAGERSAMKNNAVGTLCHSPHSEA